jgi:multicomponent Na+:H+ antiporter subunit G
VTVLSVAFVSAGIFFLLAGAAGLLRFPDFYTRMHASGKCDTLGALLVLVGLACHEGASLASVKMLLIAAFLFLASPAATHAIARSALRHQNALWSEEEQ